MELSTVVVSPMRRTMQTAYHVLKDHPKFSSLKFVLMPICREHIWTVGDIARSPKETIATATSLFPNVDTYTFFASKSDVEHWQIEDQLPHIKDEIELENKKL